MLRTGQLLAPLTGTLPLRFDRRDLSRRREPCYRGPWRLPGPDLHRLADDSLSLGYAIRFSFSSGCRELLPERRLRAAPRVVKRKMSSYNVKGCSSAGVTFKPLSG